MIEEELVETPEGELTASKDSRSILKRSRRVIVGVIGGTVVLIGLALIFLPGPGLLVIFAGLAILGAEFAWARSLYQKGRQQAASLLSRKPKDPPTP